MNSEPKSNDQQSDLKCPECHAVLKHRRARTPDQCEMICGGCGRQFDVCDLETLDMLKKQS